MEPASPSAYVSASLSLSFFSLSFLSLSLSVTIMNKFLKKDIITQLNRTEQYTISYVFLLEKYIPKEKQAGLTCI